MKKSISAFLMLMMLEFAFMLPMPAKAAPLPNFAPPPPPMFAACPRGTYRVRRNTRTKKKIVNALIAGGVGAAVGGGLGGGRGALLGAGAGSGGYLTYRYIRDRRGRCVPRYVRG